MIVPLLVFSFKLHRGYDSCPPKLLKKESEKENETWFCHLFKFLAEDRKKNYSNYVGFSIERKFINLEINAQRIYCSNFFSSHGNLK